MYAIANCLMSFAMAILAFLAMVDLTESMFAGAVAAFMGGYYTYFLLRE